MPACGCARIAKVRRSVFHRETTVPSAELSQQEIAANAGFGRSRGSRKSSSGPLGRLTSQSNAWQTVGQSVEGRPIEARLVGTGATRVLFIGGIHGDEPEGQPLIEQLAEELRSSRSLTRGRTVLLIRDLNPDGTAGGTRSNKNGVDLNRNFPASNWDSVARQSRFNPGLKAASEPETRLLVDLLREFQPERILVMHATRGKPMVNYDGPAREIAGELSRLSGYAATDSIGYPTPGSLGSYAGIDMQIPIITLELPRGIAAAEAWAANAQALQRFIQ